MKNLRLFSIAAALVLAFAVSSCQDESDEITADVIQIEATGTDVTPDDDDDVPGQKKSGS